MKKYNTKRIDFNEEIYNFILGYFKKNMLVPTVREIVDGTSYKSSSSVYMHMRRMIRLGKLNQIGERFCLPRDVVVEIINELESEE